MPSLGQFLANFRSYMAQVCAASYLGCFYDCSVDLIFLVYSIGDSLLDAILRPNVPQIVCFSMFPDKMGNCRQIEKHLEFQDEVQREATYYIILHKILTNAPALVLGMFCGAWSDKYGRKLPMAMPSFGTTFAVLLYMAANMSAEGSVTFFLVGSFLHGCFGKTAMINMAVNSYVVDITATDKRTKKLGILAAMQFLGMFIGSLLGGLLIDSTSVLNSYCCVSAMSALVVILTLGLLRESVSVDESDVRFPCSSFCKSKHVTESLMVLTKKRPHKLRRSIFGLFFVILLHQTCRTGLTDVTLLFTEKSPLSWPTSWFGYLSAADNAAMGLVLLVFLPILSNVLKLSDATISIVGLSCACVRFIVMAWSDETWMVWVAVVIGSFGGIINSPVRSLLSKMVHEDEVGKMFSLLGSGETIAKFLAVSFTSLYGYTLDIFPGFAFVLAAGLYTVMIIITLLVHISYRKDKENMDNEEEVKNNHTKMEMNHIPNGDLTKYSEPNANGITMYNESCANGMTSYNEDSHINNKGNIMAYGYSH